jgi:pyruvate dehydrogenase (quinone)
VVQVDTEPARLGVRLPVEVPVVGDAAESLMGLLPLLEQRDDTHLKR